MTTVHAGQLIYANVEKEQSPSKRGGFQTLFHTRAALTEAEVEEIEARLLYFPSDQEPVKGVFFTTSTGRYVVARIVPLDGPDRVGRGGRYLAHSLVFAAKEFARFGINPFLVFRHFSFFTTVEAALAHGDFQTGDIPPVSLEISPELPSGAASASDWSTAELKKLVLLALRADRLARDKAVVAFVGEPQHVETALEAAYFAVPIPLRSHCSFDSYFYKGNLVATYYWAVGLLESPNNVRFTVVNARTRQVLGTVPDQPESAYERWVLAAIDANDLTSISQHKEQAFALCEWLEGRSSLTSLSDTPSPQVLDTVFRVNVSVVHERLRQRLAEQLPAVLASRVFPQVSQSNDPSTLFQKLSAGFQLPQLLEILSALYATNDFRVPPPEELQALEQLLRRTDHRTLRLLHCCWTTQREPLRKTLEQLSDDEYGTFVQTALRYHLIDPHLLVVRSKGERFLDLYKIPNMEQSGDFVALVECLCASGEEACLSRLAPHLSLVSNRDLQKLEKIVTRHFKAPEVFRTALSEALTARPRFKRAKEMFNHLIKYWPGANRQ
jgi:hypothetical protein